jgi:serine/threonine protein kinase
VEARTGRRVEGGRGRWPGRVQTPPVLHRDLKPANVVLRPDGTLALVDFGSVRTLSTDRTHGSTLVGTFGYMPPEQLGGTVDRTSDLYALGATLLHDLTGRDPAGGGRWHSRTERRREGWGDILLRRGYRVATGLQAGPANSTGMSTS